MNKLQFNNDMTIMYDLTTTIRWIFLVQINMLQVSLHAGLHSIP